MRLKNTPFYGRLLAWRKHGYVFLIFVLITVVLFGGKIWLLPDAYGMSDVDTDGTLWFYWAQLRAERMQQVFPSNNLIGYPYGYDLTYIPYKLPFYIFLMDIMKLLGGSIQAIFTVSSVASLVSYPVTAFISYLLCFRLTKQIYASFIGGLMFGFSYYFLLMGRGALSLNQLWVIPLFFLSLVYHLDKRSVVSLLLSHIVSIVAFYISPYWFFFNIFVSLPIFFFSGTKETLLRTLWSMGVFYVSLVVIFICTNLEYIYTNLAVISSREAGLHVGRDLGVVSYLLSPLSYFVPAQHTVLPLTGSGDNPIGIIPLIVLLLGLIMWPKKWDHRVWFIAGLWSILFSAHIPPLAKLNEWYFSLFYVFRAVSRLNLYAILCFSVAVSFVLTESFDKYLKITKYQIIATIVLALFMLLESSNSVPSWRQYTSISGIQKTYYQIKTDPNIKVMAVYPQQLSNPSDGVPAMHMLMGQMFHGKKLINGVDPLNSYQKDLYDQIRDIYDPRTIYRLQSVGVDTLVLHVDLIADYRSLLNRLRRDRRLEYIGRFSGEQDKDTLGDEYFTLSEKARKIDVFRLKHLSNSYVQLPSKALHSEIKNSDPYMIELESHSTGIERLTLLHPKRWSIYQAQEIDSVSKMLFGISAEFDPLKGKITDVEHYEGAAVDRYLSFKVRQGQKYYVVFDQYLVSQFSQRIRDITFIIVLLVIAVSYTYVRFFKK